MRLGRRQRIARALAALAAPVQGPPNIPWRPVLPVAPVLPAAPWALGSGLLAPAPLPQEILDLLINGKDGAKASNPLDLLVRRYCAQMKGEDGCVVLDFNVVTKMLAETSRAPPFNSITIGHPDVVVDVADRIKIIMRAAANFAGLISDEGCTAGVEHALATFGSMVKVPLKRRALLTLRSGLGRHRNKIQDIGSARQGSTIAYNLLEPGLRAAIALEVVLYAKSHHTFRKLYQITHPSSVDWPACSSIGAVPWDFRRSASQPFNAATHVMAR